ncbi:MULTISPECIES: HupE/UreJ family protein [unclassified Paenibacillus]|uniref:HupE/UreJ family protein n=1 Tax=unclassified Paenibacillus TaxID=185978 RepID=UPI0010E8736F|nr:MULTISPECIES: HupE/UreJ family protein [unclassified Paenibacillus]NIK66998.1 hydrogenase/urease accessory protein HupE [Paenibacillus sp. BK720]TCN01050.1 hydrogenase/urease accessory protein HupE [Paenibacillus sp. BK033]
MKKAIALLAFCLLLLGIVPHAYAHMNTYGYSDISVSGGQLEYDLYLDITEVSQWMDMRSGGVFVIDPGKSRAPAEGEVSWTDEDLRPLIADSLIVKAGGQPVEPTIGDIAAKERNNGQCLFVKLDYPLPDGASDYSIDYSFFFDTDPAHQNFATIREAGSSKDIVFNNGNHTVTGQLGASEADASKTTVEVPNWLMSMWEYLRIGVEHILSGIDHLLFIAALVIAKQRKRDYVKVLTAFTVGHSLTIALSALDIVNLPPAFVEPAIALSIAYVAVENIWLKKVKRRWIIAMGFGLIHGFGFAEVLRGAMSDRFLLTLFSFNVGVEIGQLAVLAVLLPLLIWIGRYKAYKYANYAASSFVAVIGLYWFVTRIIQG